MMTSPFSTVTYVSRHELGPTQLATMEKWERLLSQITRPGDGPQNMKKGISNTTHFHVELKRVTRFINTFPK